MQHVTIAKEEGPLARMKNAAKEFFYKRTLGKILLCYLKGFKLAIPIYFVMTHLSQTHVPLSYYINNLQDHSKTSKNNVVISVFQNHAKFAAAAGSIIPNAKVVFLPSEPSLDTLNQAIKKEVRDNGPIDTLAIDTHGSRRSINLDGVKYNIIDVLASLKKTQQETGRKIANNITFVGCRTIQDPSINTLKSIHQSARELNASITFSSTKVHSTTKGSAGDFYRFDANGIKAEPLHQSISTLIESQFGENSSNWYSHFKGKSFDEGITSYQKDRVAELDKLFEDDTKLEARRAQITPTISKLYNWKNTPQA